MHGEMIPASLRIPAFRRLLFADTLSVLGSMMTFIVLPIMAWSSTGSGATFALTMSGGTLGMLLMMPFGGVIADRFDRRRVLMCGDACQMLLTLTMAIAVNWHQWWVLPFITLAQSGLGSRFVSAGPALRRDALADDVRGQGNALMSAGESTASLCGPLAGVALYGLTNFTTVVVVDLLTFMASFVLIAGIRLPSAVTNPTAAASEGSSSADAVDPRTASAMVRRTMDDLAEGLRLVRADGFLRRSLAANLVNGVANGLMLICIVPWLDVELGIATSWWATLIAIMGGSSLVTALVLARVAERIAIGRQFSVGASLFFFGGLCLLDTPSVPRLCTAFILIGCANPWISVPYSTAVQRRVAGTHQGRVASLMSCSQRLPQFVAMVVGGAVMGSVGVGNLMMIVPVGFCLAACIYLASAHRLQGAPCAEYAHAADRELAVSG